MSTQHAKLSPSSAHRWVNCPPSIAVTDKALAEGLIKIEPFNAAAMEGTVAHELAEMCLLGDLNPMDYIGQAAEVDPNYVYDMEMCEYVTDYVGYVKEHTPDTAELAIEQRVNISRWVPNSFGTADAVISDHGKLTVIDLKYGRGVRVDAVDNLQGALYALGAYDALPKSIQKDIKDVEIIIYQPRINNIDHWQVKIGELLRIGDMVKVAANEKVPYPSDDDYTPGDWCRFCPVSPICKAQEQHLYEALSAEFDDLTPVNLLDDEALGRILAAKPVIEAYLSAVQKYVTERIGDGEPFAGYKLVAGRRSRKWVDESEAADVLEAVLGDDVYTRRIIRPAQAEKVLGRRGAKVLADIVAVSDGAPTLVPESDPRPSVMIGADAFDDIS